MQSSKDIVKKAGIIPKLQLYVKDTKGIPQGTGPHRVKLLADKEVPGTDPQTGVARQEVAYLVEEKGEKKSYHVPKLDKKGQIHYLVQRLAEVNEGEEVILEGKRKGIKNYTQVIRLSDSAVQEIADEDIPVINEDELTNTEPGKELEDTIEVGQN